MTLESLKDFSDYYKRNPSDLRHNLEHLDRLESNIDLYTPDSIINQRDMQYALDWLQVAIFHGKHRVTKMLLDRLGLFDDPTLSLQERITLYTLGIE